MKKVFLPLALAIVLMACGGNETKTEPKEETPTENKTEDISQNPDYKKGLALVAKSGCLACHQVQATATGPSYKEVAKRYENATDTTIDRIANHIVNGGSGIWGSVPMTPHPTVSIDEARQMVKYVLLLK